MKELLLAAFLTAAPNWAGHDAVTLYADFEPGPYAWKAAGNPYPAGTEFAVDGGRWRADERTGFLVYDGRANVPTDSGTVVIGLAPAAENPWTDGQRRCLVALPRTVEGMATASEKWPSTGLPLSLRKTTENRLELIVHQGGDSWMRGSEPITVASLEAADLDPNQPHTFAISWDFPTRTLWLAADEQVVTAPIPEAIRQPHPYLAVVFGNSESYLLTEQEPVGAPLEDAVILNVPFPRLGEVAMAARAYQGTRPDHPTQQATATLFPDDPHLARLEQIARQHLDLLVENQRHGGWCLAIKWPSHLQYSAKFRLPEPANSINLSKDSHTAFGATQLLYASQALGDEKYLAAAKRTGDMYLETQDPEQGFWHYVYFWENGKYVSNAPYVLLQDHTQTGPLFLLSYLWKVTGEQKYLASARKNADFLLAAQNPNGSWSHHWDPIKRVGVSSTGEIAGGEINDYGTSAPVTVLLQFAALSGEPKYREAALRGAQWLLDAFIENERVVGWAAQYGAENQPVEARHFEPVSVTQYAPRWAASGLLAAYRATKDDKYLAPLRKVIAWFEAHAVDGAWWWDYDIPTGRPIAMWQRRIYFLDDPAQVQAYVTATGRDAPRPADSVNVPQLKREVEQADTDPLTPLPPLTQESLASYLAQAVPLHVDYYVGSRTQPYYPEAGLFLHDSVSGLSINQVRHQVVRFCNVLYAARAARGDVPLSTPALRYRHAYVGWHQVLDLPPQPPRPTE